MCCQLDHETFDTVILCAPRSVLLRHPASLYSILLCIISSDAVSCCSCCADRCYLLLLLCITLLHFFIQDELQTSLRKSVKQLDEYAQQQEHKCRTAATLLQPMFDQYSVARPNRRRRASTIAAAARSEDELTVLHGGALHGLSETDLLELSHHPFNNEVRQY
jgi:hypothetical protein